MIDAQHKEWHIIVETVRGKAHERMKVDNQDAIAWKAEEADTDGSVVISLADGHGSEKYFRSHRGAELAVQAANEILGDKELADLSLANIGDFTEQMPHIILTKWEKLVEDDWKSRQLSEEENKWLESKENGEIYKAIETYSTMPYGTTLLSVLVTKHFILYMQLGDGDIITITTKGKIAEPILPDKRNFANETTSLCSPPAKEDFRIKLQRRSSNEPALIMLATDGYANSFTTREGFLKVGADIWQMIQDNGEAGLKTVEDNLKGWLERTTELGSGDDISVGFLCRLSALRQEGPETLVPLTPSLPKATTPTLFEGGTIQQEISDTAIDKQ